MTERINFESRRVGQIEVLAEDIVVFESLPGFPGRTRFVVMEHSDDAELAWLVSLDDADLAFVVASPWSFFPEYDPPVEREHLSALGIEKKDQVELLSIVTLSGTEIFLNLAAPLLINANTRRGLQVVSDDPRYTTRVAIPSLAESEKSEETEATPASPAAKAASPAP